MPARDARTTTQLPSGRDPLEVPSQRASRGAIHAGRYRIGELLGKGATGAVYGAIDTLLERPVAIKTLTLGLGGRAGLLSREARVLAAVQHPNVVVVHALHEEWDPPFLVMEWVDGDSLDRVLGERPLALREALALLRQIADGLDAIHAAGAIHGDVKPSNVMVGRDRRVRIVDVGLVPVLERMEAGEVLGTPAYLPPERALGAIATPELGARADVYSFAVVAFELLTGRLPFRDERRDSLLHAHAHVPAPRPSDVSRLARVFDEPFARALSKRPDARYARAGELVDALERAASAVDGQGAALRILIVDDDADIRALFAFALAASLRGVVVETASDGEAALDAIRRQKPSVAVLDLQMPGLHGVELVRAARRLAPTLPILVCTGQGSGRRRPKGRGGGGLPCAPGQAGRAPGPRRDPGADRRAVDRRAFRSLSGTDACRARRPLRSRHDEMYRSMSVSSSPLGSSQHPNAPDVSAAARPFLRFEAAMSSPSS